MQWRNWGGALDAIAPPTGKSLPFLKQQQQQKIKIIIFVLRHLNFYSAVEKPIFKMFIRTK